LSLWRAIGSLAAFIACLGFAPLARADLAGEAARLASSWEREGQKVLRLPPAFVEHGRVKLFQIEPNGPGATFATSPTGCTAVALLGVRTAEFTASPDRALMIPRGSEDLASEDDRRMKSSSGVALLGRCGAAQADLRRIVVDVTASRSTIEVVVAQGERGPTNVPEVLPERAVGPLAARGDSGATIDPGPLAARLARARVRALAEGAALVTTSPPVNANDTGAGSAILRLVAGCHRLDVFGEMPARAPHRPVDIDAEVRDLDSGRLLARDRADVPDARLDFCVGDTTRVEVSFVGAAEGAAVTISDGLFKIPARVPLSLGKRARGGLSWALHRRHAADPVEAPVIAALGVSGLTIVPFEVEPGRCYLGAVSVTKGDARAVRLSAEVDGHVAHDESADFTESAAIAFCAGTSRLARLEVEVRGTSPWWMLAVWPAGTTAP
jgi:hypothetical protein